MVNGQTRGVDELSTVTAAAAPMSGTIRGTTTAEATITTSP